MNSNIILELREKDGVEIGNGNFETFLSNPITIEAGDTVLMKQCFIDTIATSTQLVIPDDITLIIHSGIYVNDWAADGKKVSVINNSNTGALDGSGYGGNHIAYKFLNEGNIIGYTTYTGAEYSIIFAHPSKVYPVYQYINVNNQIQTFTGYIPDTRPSSGGYVDVFSLIAKTGSIKLIAPDAKTFQQAGWQFNNFNESTIPPSKSLYKPYIFQSKIPIKSGSYNPADLAIQISETLSQNNAGLKTFSTIVTNNSFLKSSDLFDVNKPQPDGSLNPDGTPALISQPVAFIADDGSMKFNFETGSAYWIGASEIALEYDASTDKFNFTFLHTPQYTETGGIIVRYGMVNNSVSGTNFASSKNGGIFFESLSAVDSNNNYFPFWDKLLGFDLTTLCVNYTIYENICGIIGSVYIPNFIDGISTTTGYYGLASAVTFNPSWNKVPVIAAGGITSTIDNTINIISSKTTAELINTYSHFLIEADLKFSNNIFGLNTLRNIQGIVSKYYSAGSYTFGDTSGSIQYVHTGAPLILKSIKVRILTSNKIIDPTIGDDNTVYFQIIKANNNILT
jgi:hypothetical protein